MWLRTAAMAAAGHVHGMPRLTCVWALPCNDKGEMDGMKWCPGAETVFRSSIHRVKEIDEVHEMAQTTQISGRDNYIDSSS